MFKFEINSKLKPGVLLAYYNIEEKFLLSLKNCIEDIYKNNINYFEITNEQLKIQRIKRRKEKNFDELGMISINWVQKTQERLPGVIIQMIEITDLVNTATADNSKIPETVMKEILKIKNNYQSSNQFIIIKNLKRDSGLENSIKNQVLSRFKYLNDKCIFFINDPNYMTNSDIIKKISTLVKDEISKYYTSKIKYYRNKYKNHENNEQKEYAIKYLIRTFLLSKISNIINIDNTINYYDYIQKAYNILSNKLLKKTYMFCQPNIKVIYLELKNIADFLILQLLSQDNISIVDLINIIIRHLYNFDFIHFNDDKKTDIKKIITSCKKMKDIYFINMAWKHSWYSYLLEKYKKIDLDDINYISLKGHIMNNLLHLYFFLINEPNFIQEINSTVNFEISYEKIKNIKYIEKIPKYYEIDGENIVGKLSDEENLSLYICELIFNNKNLVKPQNIIKILENLILNSKTNYYDYFLMHNYCLKNNEKDEAIDNILAKLLHKNNQYLIKFPKIYSHLSEKLNKYILDKKIDNNEKNNYDIFKMIEYLILYSSITKKELTNDETNKINELLKFDLNSNNNLIKINSFENQIFNIEVTYNVNKVNPLDFITNNIKISLLRKNIVMKINKIIIYFPNSNKNEKEKNYKKIILNKELTSNNPIEINFNKLVKFLFSNLYITHIKLYLQNNLKILLTNKEKRNIVLNDKNNDTIKESDIIDINLTKNKKNMNEKCNIEKSKVILIGKDENHLFCINYKTKINNDDVYIKHTKIVIQLISGFSRKGEEIKCFSFKTINNKGYNNCGNKPLILEYENVNFEQNPPPFEFILQIGETGNFGINYDINFTLINKECLDDYYYLNLHKNIILQCIESFHYYNEVNSSLYYINQQSKTKFYPMNHPISLTSFFENKLSENIIIKKILYYPSSNNFQINSSLEKLFSKKQNYKLSFLSGEKISFHCTIISKEISNISPGKIKILWISDNIYNHNYFNLSMLNESIFDLRDLNITKLPLIIQGKFINGVNKYQIRIKNLESMSKIIKFSMKEINRESKEEKFILCGKTNITDVLLPLKEYNLQYNVYDTITGSNLIDINDNIAYKFNNIITLNEYYILEKKDKSDKLENALRNIIYYIPEIFKLTN